MNGTRPPTHNAPPWQRAERMSRSRSRPTERAAGVPLGTRVRIHFPAATLDGEVVEDRGFIGIGGRQLVVVRTMEETYFPREMEFAVADLEIVAPPGKDRAA